MTWVPPSLPVPEAKRSILPEQTPSICARWIRILVRRDPTCGQGPNAHDVGDLLRDFAEEQGFSLAELAIQFREEEEEYSRLNREKWRREAAKRAEKERGKEARKLDRVRRRKGEPLPLG